MIVAILVWLVSDFFLFTITDDWVAKTVAHIFNTMAVGWLVWQLMHSRRQYNKLIERYPEEK